MRRDHSSDIRWFVCCSAAALGERGTSGAAIDQLKYGIPASHGEPRFPFSDEQLGFGSKDSGHVNRWRRCYATWSRIGKRCQNVLWARFDSRQWDPGVASAFDSLSGVVAMRMHERHSGDWRIELARASQALGREAIKRRAALRVEAERDVACALQEWADTSTSNAHRWAEGVL